MRYFKDIHSVMVVLVTASLELASLVSCKARPEESEVLVDGLGAKVSKDFPSVVRLESPGPCTGTFVGNDTLIAAAHCIGPNGKIGFADHKGKIHQSTKLWHHGVTGADVPVTIIPHAVQRDFVIAQFAGVTFPHTQKMGFGLLKAGSETTMIGYAVNFQLPDYRGGDKVASTKARIHKIDRKGALFLGSPSLSGGDSGGPLILNDDSKVYGVVSFGQPEMPDNKRVSVYALLSHPENVKLLHKAQREGASIPKDVLPPEETCAPSSSSVKGRYDGSRFCSEEGITDICPIKFDFKDSGMVNFSSGSIKESELRFMQRENRLLIGRGTAPIKESDRTSYTELAVCNDGKFLTGIDGSIFSKAGRNEPAPLKPEPVVPTGTKILVCIAKDQNRSLKFIDNNNVVDFDGGREFNRKYKREFSSGSTIISIFLDSKKEIYVQQAHLLIPQPTNLRKSDFTCALE